MKLKYLFIALLITLVIKAGFTQPTKQPQLWGMTTGFGPNKPGTIFAINPDGTNFTIYHRFTEATGAVPNGNLTIANNKKIYGVTTLGGLNGKGVLFSFDPLTGIYTDLVNFDGTNGQFPRCVLLLATDGNLYGVTEQGGNNHQAGVLFMLNPSTNAFVVIINFPAAIGTGILPTGSLMQARNGLIYGTTSGSVSNIQMGTIFTLQLSNNAFTEVKKLSCDSNFCESPFDKLLQAGNGLLYGQKHRDRTPSQGPAVSEIFSFDPLNNSLVTIASRSGFNYDIYGGSLVQAGNGKLYGIFNDHNASPASIFCLDITGGNVLTDVFTFSNSFDGRYPWGHLMLASDGMLYGMTSEGGTGGGTIFRFNPNNNSFSKIHSFDFEQNDGQMPTGDIIEVKLPH